MSTVYPGRLHYTQWYIVMEVGTNNANGAEIETPKASKGEGVSLH